MLVNYATATEAAAGVLFLVSTRPLRQLKANTRLCPTTTNIFIRARGQRSNLNSPESKGCNSNVRRRLHLQAAAFSKFPGDRGAEAEFCLGWLATASIQKQILRRVCLCIRVATPSWSCLTAKLVSNLENKIFNDFQSG